MNGAQRKTIRKILREKINDWLKSIDDVEVRATARDNVIVTGGSICSLLMGDKVNDYDIYMRNIESTERVARYYVDKFNELNQSNIQPKIQVGNFKNIKGHEERRVCVFVQSSGAAGEGDDSSYEYYEMTDNVHGDRAEQFINDIGAGRHGDKLSDEEAEESQLPKYRPVFLSQNAITLKNKVQFVIRFYGEPDEIHDNYDFVHACCSYDYARDELDMPVEALESMMSKTLYYRGSLYPICSVFRARKFIERGWKINAGEMLKMCWQISEIDLSDMYTLREQLTGVDAAYMHQLIKLMDKHKEENANLEIDSSYMVQLIDKVYNA